MSRFNYWAKSRPLETILMKKLNYILLPVLLLTILSCKKTDNKIITPSANLLIANVVAGGSTLTFNPTTAVISNNGSTNFPVPTGQSQISLSDNSQSPAVNYYNQSFMATNAGNYTLFLAGGSPALIDPILIQEHYQNYTDSVCAVRFINLSPNSSPVSVNITGQTNGSEVTSLAYKAYSSFKQYPAKKANVNYAFQFRNATTGALIASYTLVTPYFHNVTIVLRGLVGSSPAAGVTLVSHL
ncbi:MAG: hypothetical protein JWP37_599 [Mucilaginibacter sp.]|nr:hypothetical protein [Mucilaginibacter sp.]